jgi:hypothetical protein
MGIVVYQLQRTQWKNQVNSNDGKLKGWWQLWCHRMDKRKEDTDENLSGDVTSGTIVSSKGT